MVCNKEASGEIYKYMNMSLRLTAFPTVPTDSSTSYLTHLPTYALTNLHLSIPYLRTIRAHWLAILACVQLTLAHLLPHYITN